jgi:hypothetical protein
LQVVVKPAVEELIVEVVREEHNDGALSKAIPAKDLGRLTLAIMQGEEFLQKGRMPLADLKGIDLAVKKLLFSDLIGKRGRSNAVRR